MLRGCPSSTLVYISVPEDRDASPRFFMRLAAIQGRDAQRFNQVVRATNGDKLSRGRIALARWPARGGRVLCRLATRLGRAMRM
jgi:hypothetical protein